MPAEPGCQVRARAAPPPHPRAALVLGQSTPTSDPRDAQGGPGSAPAGRRFSSGAQLIGPRPRPPMAGAGPPGPVVTERGAFIPAAPAEPSQKPGACLLADRSFLLLRGGAGRGRQDLGRPRGLTPWASPSGCRARMIQKHADLVSRKHGDRHGLAGCGGLGRRRPGLARGSSGRGAGPSPSPRGGARPAVTLCGVRHSDLSPRSRFREMGPAHGLPEPGGRWGGLSGLPLLQDALGGRDAATPLGGWSPAGAQACV